MDPSISNKILWSGITVIGISILGWIMRFTSPDSIIIIIVWLMTIGLILFSAIFAIFAHTRRALLISVGVVLFLILRILGLRDIYYAILLLVCLISLELYLNSQ